MARDAGLEIDESGDIDEQQIWYFVFADLERFATAIRAATKDEDAQICDQFANVDAQYCADAIRASK